MEFCLKQTAQHYLFSYWGALFLWIPAIIEVWAQYFNNSLNNLWSKSNRVVLRARQIKSSSEKNMESQTSWLLQMNWLEGLVFSHARKDQFLGQGCDDTYLYWCRTRTVKDPHREAECPCIVSSTAWFLLSEGPEAQLGSQSSLSWCCLSLFTCSIVQCSSQQ